MSDVFVAILLLSAVMFILLIPKIAGFIAVSLLVYLICEILGYTFSLWYGLIAWCIIMFLKRALLD